MVAERCLRSWPGCATPSSTDSVYLDTAAALKVVVAEPGSKALLTRLVAREGRIVSSDLVRTELLRATRRAEPEQMVQARAVLDSVILMTLPTAVFERAATLEPDLLRSLDALHLAAALELGDELDGVVTCDQRLVEGAKAPGISVIAPT